MTLEEKNLCRQLYLQKMPYADFLQIYPTITEEYLLDELNGVSESHDAEVLRNILLIGSYHGYTNEIGRVLSAFLTEDWHKEHEDIARVIQFRTPVPEAINNLSRAVSLRFNYLFEQDDYYPFVRKCLNAIRSIGSEEARTALETIIYETTDLEIKQLAEGQLAKM